MTFALGQAFAQDRVVFKAEDGLDVVAYLYEINEDYPYILLFHQRGYSKGEFKDIAISLLNLKYNCLAVDLRFGGGMVNSIPNETAINAQNMSVLTSLYDAGKDVEAAVDYAFEKSNKKVLLLGSSCSGTLAIKTAKNHPKVKGVIAYSPGEFFKNQFSLYDEMQDYDKPIYVAGSQTEYPHLLDLMEKAPQENITIFQPQNAVGKHGAKALWKNDEVYKEYWLSLLTYINKLK